VEDLPTLLAFIDWDYVQEWLGLFRWLHVVAAIFWVGITAYFILVDNYMLPVQEADPEADAIGERYVLHGGSLYFVRRHAHGSRKLPRTTYWSSPWYAYVTWISGFTLMVVVYYWDASATLVDPTRVDMSGLAAVALSLAVLVLGLIVYVVVSRVLIGQPRLCWAALMALIAATAWGLGEVFTDRGAYIQVGALMGTWMTTNVLFVFVPAHHLQAAARKRGEGLDPRVARRAAQRGSHNTYLALPVLVAMLSGHWPVLYGSEQPVVALLVVLALAGLLRLFFVERQMAGAPWRIPVFCAIALVALAVWIKPDAPESLAQDRPEQAEPAPTPAPEPEPAAEPEATPREPEPDAVDGALVFRDNCSSCHTLADAGASGSVGPDLDTLAPDAAQVAATVTSGRGVMPAFGGQLSPEEIDAVAEYVERAAGG
jgi:uncharacterized membrane protein